MYMYEHTNTHVNIYTHVLYVGLSISYLFIDGILT